ncbi:MAG TPA: hypothetical protein VHE99_07750 [Gammaproteobacteria bacterium]|nr:hypothetical protein [Gammaproteobacteria bacterium]
MEHKKMPLRYDSAEKRLWLVVAACMVSASIKILADAATIDNAPPLGRFIGVVFAVGLLGAGLKTASTVAKESPPEEPRPPSP